MSQFVSQLLEFLLIKEKGKNPHWCSDRDGIATKCDGILFFLVNFGLARLLRGRVSDFWLHLPAEILGISYTTLLAMRKEDKADGIQRIPYRGEGKNTRYYVPLLKAYKSKDMALVNKLAKEIG